MRLEKAHLLGESGPVRRLINRVDTSVDRQI